MAVVYELNEPPSYMFGMHTMHSAVKTIGLEHLTAYFCILMLNSQTNKQNMTYKKRYR